MEFCSSAVKILTSTCESKHYKMRCLRRRADRPPARRAHRREARFRESLDIRGRGPTVLAVHREDAHLALLHARCGRRRADRGRLDFAGMRLSGALRIARLLDCGDIIR